MGIVRKTMTLTAALAGFVVASQAPEFAQQYRQRLGGAVQELRAVAENFDRDASASNMTRKEALFSMNASNSDFTRDRSVSMATSIQRFESLRGQRMAMERMDPLFHPASVLANTDKEIVRDAWTDFTPAVPLTPAGAIWGGIGAVASGALLWLTMRLFGGRGKQERTGRTGTASRRVEPTF